LGQTISKNISLSNLGRISKFGVMDLNKEIVETGANAKQFGVKCSSIFQEAGNLSGGNQQKVVLAKWMFNLPEVLILDEPTRGIDVGAKYDIYCIINELAAAGKCVLVISSELPEILGICDRVYVMNEGEIKGEMPIEEASQESIMRLLV
jgi:putative multiple sugar transport system ATP-binding protein